MRVSIPKFETKKQLFSYLKTNKFKIISQKKSIPVTSEIFDFGCLRISAKEKSLIGKNVTKEHHEDVTMGDGEIRPEVVANLHGWCDYHMDVLIPGSADKTISEKGASNKQLIYHLKNHHHSTDGIIGGDVKMRTETLDLSMFNIETEMTEAEALIGSSTVKKKYDPKCYHLYSDDEIKQHSIGLKYMRIFLCVDTEEEDMQFEKEMWDKYYPFVINKNKVDDKGYFWAVVEYKLLEYSAVLFGANELTPVLNEQDKNIEPSEDTQEVKQDESDDSKKDETSLSEFYKLLNN